jgi:hypothetical protein
MRGHGRSYSYKTHSVGASGTSDSTDTLSWT